MSRVMKPTGALLIRDLKRPTKFSFPFHAWWFGRHYSGLMKQLYLDSLRASYTLGELKDLLNHSSLSGCNVFQLGWSHIGIEKNQRLKKSLKRKLWTFNCKAKNQKLAGKLNKDKRNKLLNLDSRCLAYQQLKLTLLSLEWVQILTGRKPFTLI